MGKALGRRDFLAAAVVAVAVGGRARRTEAVAASGEEFGRLQQELAAAKAQLESARLTSAAGTKPTGKKPPPTTPPTTTTTTPPTTVVPTTTTAAPSTTTTTTTTTTP